MDVKLQNAYVEVLLDNFFIGCQAKCYVSGTIKNIK